MKKLSVLFGLTVLFSVVLAQSNVQNLGPRPMPSFIENEVNVSQTPNPHSHVFLKSQRNASVVRIGSRNVNTINIGRAGNIFTILDGDINRIATNQALNTVVFIHRADTVSPFNLGQYKYAVSSNGGNTWQTENGPLNPTGDNINIAGRYPNVVIHNPSGNTNPQNAFLGYMGSWLPFGRTNATWEGYYTGTARLNNNVSTFRENIRRPNNGRVYIVKSMVKGAPGIFWSMDVEFDGTNFLPRLLINRGIFNPATNDIDWTQTPFPVPFDLTVDGRPRVTSPHIAFDPTGQFGWIGFLGDVRTTGNNVYEPVFYRTINGGNSWIGPIALDLSSFPIVVNNINGTVPTTGFDMDLVVDGAGNPHLLTIVGFSGTTDPYTISTGTNAGLKVFNFNWNPLRPQGSQWEAMLLDSAQTFRGNITGDITEDNRPQASVSEDGSTVFFGWLDTDNLLASGNSNSLPNFRTIGYNINTGLATPVVNWTEGDVVWDGSALFASTAYNTLKNGTFNHIPTVFAEVLLDDANPCEFWYARGVGHDDNTFTRDFTAPLLSLLGANPLTLTLGTPYVDPGATATDNVGGNLTSSIVTNSSAVNVNSVGTYTVTYTVSDAAGNLASATRTVRVIANPDNVPPTISLVGANPLILDVCDFFFDPGVTANDNIDGNITANVTSVSTVIPGVPGSYTITYNVLDGAGNAATPLVRVVELNDLPPVILFSGDDTIRIEACTPFVDPGAFGFDNCAGSLTLNVSGTVNVNAAGTYTVTYTANDGVNADVTRNRIVVVTPDVTPPVITLQGSNPLFVYLGDPLVAPPATAEDCLDGNISSAIVVNNSAVNTTARGTYQLPYTVTDAAGNPATVNRTVIVNTEPDADFTFEIRNAQQPFLVNFTDKSLYVDAGTQVQRRWDFGDPNGTSSTITNPTFNFRVAGSYEVCLRTTNVFNQAPFSKPASIECKQIVLTSARPSDLQAQIVIFPNPAKSKVSIDIQDNQNPVQQISVHNILGEVMEVRSFNAFSNGRVDFNTENYPSGIYFIHIQAGGFTRNHKFMISQ